MERRNSEAVPIGRLVGITLLEIAADRAAVVLDRPTEGTDEGWGGDAGNAGSGDERGGVGHEIATGQMVSAELGATIQLAAA
jgi:hypothetical protein